MHPHVIGFVALKVTLDIIVVNSAKSEVLKLDF
jgi:hypothetical protein